MIINPLDCDYVTKEDFGKFLSNDFGHLKWKVDAVFWVVMVILAAIIGQWVTA